MAVKRQALSAALVEAFAGAFLSPMYDNPQPTPQFHRQGWELYCSPWELCSIVAPREHAKSTALTHDFGLATILFRAQDYVLVVSATEDLAIGHLGDMAKELRENDDLRQEFGVTKLVSDAKTDVIVEFSDGHQARILAKGSGQKMRGLKWNGKRPGLILCDDLEEDEQVSNIDRRRAFRRWFYRALLPARRRGGIVRVHGTILHEDSLLARLQKASTWRTLFFSAHASFDDFSRPLWPEQFPTSRLRAIRQGFIDAGDSAGYSQEYLNSPLDDALAFLPVDGFLPMSVADFESPQLIRIGCDFAVSKSDQADRTSFTVGGQTPANTICIRDQHAGRWDTSEWIDKMFELQERWEPEEWTVEGGVIWKAVWPVLQQEMASRNVWMNFRVINPVKDKATRGLALKKRHRAGAMRYNKEAPWYEGYEHELRRFTGVSDALADDQFDSTALLVRGFEESAAPDEDDFRDEEEIEMENQDPRRFIGRDEVTGY